MQKINENMWCYNYEHEWNTDDYYECKDCLSAKLNLFIL